MGPSDQIDDGQRDGVSSEAAAEIRALRRRNAELEQTIEMLVDPGVDGLEILACQLVAPLQSGRRR